MILSRRVYYVLIMPYSQIKHLINTKDFSEENLINIKRSVIDYGTKLVNNKFKHLRGRLYISEKDINFSATEGVVSCKVRTILRKWGIYENDYNYFRQRS